MGRPRTPSQHDESTVLWGYLLVFLASAWFILMMFNAVGAKFLLPTGNPLLDFLATDWYYPCLVVLCIPSTLVAVYLNWFAMKFFVHN